MRIAEQSAPSVEPVLLSEAKEYLRVDGTDEDTRIASLIASARQMLESNTGLYLINRAVDIYYDSWPLQTVESGVSPGCFSTVSHIGGAVDTAIALPVRPVNEILSISWFDEQGNEHVLDAGSYLLQPGLTPILSRTGLFPWPMPLRKRDGIRISLTAGFGADWNTVPSDIIQALLRLITVQYFHPGDELSLSSGLLRSNGIYSLLAPYRRVRV